MTPFQLLTGVKMRTKQDLEILKLLEEEIVETFTENREKIREEANILKMQEENCRNFNKKRERAYQYEIGRYRHHPTDTSLSVPSFVYVSDSPLVSMKKKKKKRKERSTTADSVRSGWPLWNRHPIEARSLRAQAQLIQGETKTLTIEKKAEKD
ncbi:hypothetical protein TNCV_4020931 [Trichonephila clavipes]|nr:hypothetical protein TNCV_4020931 [Trichonephila clavipes]